MLLCVATISVGVAMILESWSMEKLAYVYQRGYDFMCSGVVTEHGADNYKILSMSSSRENKKEIYFFMFFFYFHLLTLKLLTAVKNLCVQNMLQHLQVCVSYLTTKIAFLVPQTSVLWNLFDNPNLLSQTDLSLFSRSEILVSLMIF